MFTRSHLQELKRRYASIYAPPVEEKVIEDGTIEGANQYKKDTPGQDIEKEFKEHCGVCGEQGIEEDEIEEGWPEIGKMKDSVTKMFGRIKDLKSQGLPPAAYEDDVEELRDKIREKQKKIKELETAQRAIDAKKKKTGPATGFPVGHRESVEVNESLALQLKMALDDAKIKMKSKKGKIVIAKRDKKKAMDVLTKTLPSNLKKYVDKAVDNFLVFEEVEIDEAEVAYPPTIKNLKMIVKDKQNQIFMFPKGKARVDLFTASAMVQVYDALKPATKKKFEDMIKSKEGFIKSQAFAMKMVK